MADDDKDFVPLTAEQATWHGKGYVAAMEEFADVTVEMSEAYELIEQLASWVYEHRKEKTEEEWQETLKVKLIQELFR